MEKEPQLMNDHDVCVIINFVMEYNPVINGTDLAAAYPLRKADALRPEQADNFAWLALPLSDVCCARKEKKEMAGQAAERWAESRRVCCMCVRKARQRKTRAGEWAGHGGQGGAMTSTGGREGGVSEQVMGKGGGEVMCVRAVCGPRGVEPHWSPRGPGLAGIRSWATSVCACRSKDIPLEFLFLLCTPYHITSVVHQGSEGGGGQGGMYSN